jgi:hypothetical protein
VVALLVLALQEFPRAPYRGWSEAVALEGGGTRAVVVPEAGGRIVSFGRGGENVLWENPDYLGKTLANTAPEKLAQGYLGYNIDLGPELRGIPRHLKLWMGPHRASTAGPGALRLESEADEAVGMRIVRELRVDPSDGRLSIKQAMENVSGKEQSYCLWDRTLCAGGGFAFFPLNPRSRFKAGWAQVKDKSYVGDAPSHPNVKVLDGVLVAKGDGKSSKLGADSDAGWIAYAKGRQLFVKYYPVFPDGKYTDGGCTVELYFDPKVCELEPLSPEVALKPGERYEFPEVWALLPIEKEPATHEEARALAGRVPPNPFKR